MILFLLLAALVPQQVLIATSRGQVSSRSLATSSASSLEPRNEAASAVTRMMNGNSAIRVDSAMWLAVAQPSLPRKE